ncbi:CrcB-like protein [Rubrobacter radiotolerans]|uniref:Fluoride-specific ion channel FluC n=1 Tax=Rubrobacter radiotolerans TaxID=42256 RepID=A0A023X667_RUBRA|nr:CrcB-like protein [Rubrobacter radiotolerans]SMC07773.1 CrcB protein [Rubrobacter radiotolerans DSM 5868]
MRLGSEADCERVIRAAHERGVASAMAYSGPEDGVAAIFVMIIDEPPLIESFLPELKRLAPEAGISVSFERLAHVSPSDFLRGGAHRPRPFRTNLENVGLVFLGGAFGGSGRVLLEAGARYVTPAYEVFPWGTLVANVVGSFFIAVLGVLLLERFISERERMFWILGFLGSFTTFSAFIFQIDRGWELSPTLSALYAGSSMFLGLAAALLGILATRRFVR